MTALDGTRRRSAWSGASPWGLPSPEGSGVRRRPTPGDGEEGEPFPLLRRRSAPSPFAASATADVEDRLLDAFLATSRLQDLLTPWAGVRLVVASLRRLVPCEIAFGSRYDIDDDVLRVVSVDPPGPLSPAARVLRIDSGLAGWAVRSRAPVLRATDDAAGFRLGAVVPGGIAYARNAMYVPLRREDLLVGLLQVVNRRNATEFSEADARVMVYLGERLADQIQSSSLALAL